MMLMDTRAEGQVGMRRQLKSALAHGLVKCGLHKLVGSARGLAGAPLVLGYHRVVENFPASAALAMPSLLVSTATLARQLEWVGRHYDFVSLDELELVLAGVLRMRRPVAALTFDDGYRDVLEQGMPLLQRMGIPATVYVVSDLTGTDKLQRHDELYLLFALMHAGGGKGMLQELDCAPGFVARLQQQIDNHATPFQLARLVLETLTQHASDVLLVQMRDLVHVEAGLLEQFQSLDWNMLKTWVQSGMTVGSHTCSHPLLPGLPPAQLHEELQHSRRVLETRLHVPVRHFAYPDGRFDTVTVAAVAAAGYHTATTICGHVDARQPQLTLARRMLWENSSNDANGGFSPAVLGCQVNGIFDPADRCRLSH